MNHPATYLLGLPMLLSLAACANIEPAEEHELVATTSAAVVGNPSLTGPYKTCLHKRYYKHYTGPFTGTDTYLARIRYASTNGVCSQPQSGPLVMIMRAYGGSAYDYVNYDVLAKHLASHGYIVASLNLEGTAANTAEVNEAFMTEYMLFSWEHASAVDPTHVGLVGHSRGADAAMLMADSFEGGSDPFTVGAIVSLAGSFQHHHPTAAQTDGLLVLQFSNDSDVNAKSSASYYDEPYGAARFDRSFKLFEGGGHASFLGPEGAEGAELTQGYTLTFLDTLLRGDPTGYDAYIRGDDSPHVWSGGAIVSQYRDRFALQVDTFEDGTVGNNDLGGGVYRSSGIYYDAVADLSTLGASTIHRTQALQILAVGSNQHVTWRIPAADANTQGLGVLSLRMAQVTGSPSDDMTVQIRNGNVWSPEVPLADWGSIGQPIDACSQSNAPFCTAFYDADVMSTIRVPLTEFGASHNIRRIRLNFRGDSTYRHFYIDDVEVSEIANIN
jgi:dienelactone hydrolase